MGKYEAEGGWWTHLRVMEPAVLRGILTAIVTAAAVWGLEWSPWADRIDQTYTALVVIVPLVQAWWTRTAVSPANQVPAPPDE